MAARPRNIGSRRSDTVHQRGREFRSAGHRQRRSVPRHALRRRDHRDARCRHHHASGGLVQIAVPLPPRREPRWYEDGAPTSLLRRPTPTGSCRPASTERPGVVPEGVRLARGRELDLSASNRAAWIRLTRGPARLRPACAGRRPPQHQSPHVRKAQPVVRREWHGPLGLPRLRASKTPAPRAPRRTEGRTEGFGAV